MSRDPSWVKGVKAQKRELDRADALVAANRLLAEGRILDAFQDWRRTHSAKECAEEFAALRAVADAAHKVVDSRWRDSGLVNVNFGVVCLDCDQILAVEWMDDHVPSTLWNEAVHQSVVCGDADSSGLQPCEDPADTVGMFGDLLEKNPMSCLNLMSSTILNGACPYCNGSGSRCISTPTPLEAIPPISEWVNGCITIRYSYVYVTCVCRGGAPPEPE
jgi:hypothetical protein